MADRPQFNFANPPETTSSLDNFSNSKADCPALHCRPSAVHLLKFTRNNYVSGKSLEQLADCPTPLGGPSAVHPLTQCRLTACKRARPTPRHRTPFSPTGARPMARLTPHHLLDEEHTAMGDAREEIEPSIGSDMRPGRSRQHRRERAWKQHEHGGTRGA